MAIVERLLPRHWDGRRLLQFLTGLALLALAFALPGGAVATPATPAPVASIVSATVDAPAAAPAGETDQAATTAEAPLAPPADGVFVPIAVRVESAALADGDSQRAWGSRGPPRA